MNFFHFLQNIIFASFTLLSYLHKKMLITTLRHNEFLLSSDRVGYQDLQRQRRRHRRTSSVSRQVLMTVAKV